MHSYTLDDLHYNRKRVIQVSAGESFEDLAKTLKALESRLKAGSKLEQKMLSFFQEEVEPKVAYKDNDVNQGKGGPRRLQVIGKLKRISGDNGLFVRLGISAPRENPLIPVLQALYLTNEKQVKYIEGAPAGLERNLDSWFYDFTDRYQGMVRGVDVRTRLGIKSLSVIPAINEAILNDDEARLDPGEPQRLKAGERS